MSLTNTASEPLVQKPTAQACVVEDVLHLIVLSGAIQKSQKICELLLFLRLLLLADKSN